MTTVEDWKPVIDVIDHEEEKRVLPHSTELEQQVLGAMMLSQNAVIKAMSVIDIQVFYSMRHRHIYQAIVELFEKGEPADLSLVAENLEKKGVLKECGGPAYLADVAASVGTSANVEYHARLLIDKAVRRRIIALSARISTKAYDIMSETSDTLTQLREDVITLGEQKWEAGYRHVSEAIERAYSRIESAKITQVGDGIMSGIPMLDAITHGFRQGEQTIIAGRPGSGKTALTLNIANHAATINGIPCGILSLEMNGESLSKRLIAMNAKISTQDMDGGKMTPEQWDQMAYWSGKLSKAPIWIDDGSRQNSAEIYVRAKRLVDNHKVRLIVVDYVQLIKPPITRRDARHQEIADISQELLAMAKELNVALLTCCQINRDVERRQDNRGRETFTPRLSDLSDSKGLEQDAHNVLFVHRPEYYGQTVLRYADGYEVSLEGRAWIYVKKQRNGPTGDAQAWWRGAWTKFEGVMEEDRILTRAEYDSRAHETKRAPTGKKSAPNTAPAGKDASDDDDDKPF